MANEVVTADRRTSTERDADAIDCELYRLICRVERLYDGAKRRRRGLEVTELHKSLQGLRHARLGIRMLMNGTDRMRTS